MNAARTLLVDDARGRFKVDIPEGCAITFGPFSPPVKSAKGYGIDGGYGGTGGGTLRVYQGSKTNGPMIACFCNVSGFRDIAMNVEREVVEESGGHTWHRDENGSS